MVLNHLQVLHRGQRHPPHPVEVDGNILDQLKDPGFFCDLKEHPVKLIVQGHQLIGVGPVQVKTLEADVGVEPLHIHGTGHLTHQLHHGALQQIAHEAGLLHQVVVNEGDGAFALGMALNDLHLRQLDEGLPHRRAGQAHFNGQLIFTDLTAGAQLQVDDIRFDIAQGIIPAALPGHTFRQPHPFSCLSRPFDDMQCFLL